MVLIRTAVAAAAAIALGACNQSLFDNNLGGSGSGSGSGSGDAAAPPDAAVPVSCPTTCLGDAAANFDGTPRGSNGRWRYVEDQNLVSWLAMAGGAAAMVGQDAGNRIAPCADSDAPACRMLPGGLLISAAGGSDVDPAIEFTANDTAVIQLAVRAYLAGGADQSIRIYRNSRADLLVAAPLFAPGLVERVITVDAIKGDRFLVALSGAQSASNVALQFFVSATGATFPASCQLAMPYPSVEPTRVVDSCGGSTFTYYEYSGITGTSKPASVLSVPGPFAELELGVDVPKDHYLDRDMAHFLDWTQDTTLQLWLRLRTVPPTPGAMIFTDRDPDTCAGVDLTAGTLGVPRLTLEACVNPDTGALGVESVEYPSSVDWHFLRLVRTHDRYDLCIDGRLATSMPALPPRMTTRIPVSIGKERGTRPTTIELDGQLDDLRVFRGALPCP